MIALVHARLVGPVPSADFPKIAWTVNVRASSTKGISQDHRKRQDYIAHLCMHLQTHPHRPELGAS